MFSTAKIVLARTINLISQLIKKKQKQPSSIIIDSKEEIHLIPKVLPDVPFVNPQINGVKVALTEAAKRTTHGCCMELFCSKPILINLIS